VKLSRKVVPILNSFIKENFFTLQFRDIGNAHLRNLWHGGRGGIRLLSLQRKFCKECGNIKDKLCYDCLGWNSEQLEVDWEDEGGADSWVDDEPH